MKKVIIFIALFLFAGIVFSQTPVFDNTTAINQTFTTHSEIFPFNGTSMYGVGISGSITFTSDTSIIKIILRDSLDVDYLIFESNTILESRTNFTFGEECEESCFIDGFTPTSLEIQIVSANVYLNNLHWRSTYLSNAISLQDQARDAKVTEKISKINTYITNNELIWEAGPTSFTDMYYNDKKDHYKCCIWNPAIEYYKTGFFSLKDADIQVNYDFVDNFEWRNRHGANDPNSNYFDGSDDGSGWVTKAACQDGCWVNGVLDCSLNFWECNGDWDGSGTMLGLWTHITCRSIGEPIFESTRRCGFG